MKGRIRIIEVVFSKKRDGRLCGTEYNFEIFGGQSYRTMHPSLPTMDAPTTRTLSLDMSFASFVCQMAV